MTITNYPQHNVDRWSYVTTEEADTLLLIHPVYQRAWTRYSRDQKQDAVIFSSNWVDTHAPWSGMREVADQPLDFPRTGILFFGEPYPDGLPSQIEEATSLFAGRFAFDPSAATTTGRALVNNIKSWKSAKEAVTYDVTGSNSHRVQGAGENTVDIDALALLRGFQDRADRVSGARLGFLTKDRPEDVERRREPFRTL